MCHKYGKKLVLTPINEIELGAWNWFHLLFGSSLGLRAFYAWHKWFVKD